jgi:uncharacterized protein (TIGR02266 family)
VSRKQHPAQDRTDKRATPRVRIEVDVSFTSESHFFVGLTGDLSEGGLFVATWRQLSVGTSVDVALALPDGLLVARGRVRWARRPVEDGPPGLGIAFEDLPEPDRLRIVMFCVARAPWYYELDE